MNTEQHPYQDPKRPVGERVDDLLSRMTFDEKLAQLGSVWAFQLMADGTFSEERAAELTVHGLGQVTRLAGATSLLADEAASVANEIQRHLAEHTRLGIPAIIHEEICSGVMARGATVFPQAIGVASSFDPTLNEEIADAIRVQMRMSGTHQGLSPVLDITRDPRWGRTEETYGEDPFLVSQMGNAFVRGLQGPDLASGVVATAKHFVGYGAPEGGMNWAPAHIGDRELREVYLHPFEAAVAAGLASVMNSYNELDGVPGAANEPLMNQLLRDTWKFEGTVVSDYFAVSQLAVYHPYWDFNATDIPNTYRDVSAAAIMSSALLELGQYTEGKEKANYVKTAKKILQNLSGDAYRNKPGENGGFILKHSVGSIPHKSEIDVPLTYADYYFLEALMRYRNWYLMGKK